MKDKQQKPLIGITAGEIINKQYPWAPVTYGQSRTYVDAVTHAGGVPVILPLASDNDVLRELYKRCDGVLMSGGNDPDPDLYGAEPIPETTDVSRRRDDQELQLITWTLQDDKPLFGICRGLQMINIALGGSLYQDIATEVPEAANHQISSERKSLTDLAHNLRIDPDSRLAQLVQSESICANAHHHQAVKQLGKGLQATAWAEDGIIEAVELADKKFVIAVQSHPESLEAEAEQRWQKLFKAFVEAAKA